MKVALDGEVINTMSAYAPQTGCGENEKIKLWEEMDEELRDIPDTEKLWVGGTSMATVEGITAEKKKPLESMEWVRAMKLEKCVAFAMSHNMRVVNTYFEKAERHKITYKIGAAESRIDNILFGSSDKGNIEDSKVFLGESVTNQ